MRGKWTPAPWNVGQYSQSITVCGHKIPCFEIASSKDACWIANVQDHRSCMATPEGNANANLIAAAPDLYEALDELLKIQGSFDGGGFREENDRARAALAKARGEA